MVVKKVVIATGIYPPSVGGPATYSKLLHDELPGRGIEVVVVTFDTVRHLPWGIRHMVYMWKLLKASFGSDLIFAQDPVSVGLPAVIVGKVMRKKIWIRVAGDYAWEQSAQRFGVEDGIDEFQKINYLWRVEFLRGLQKFSVRNADKIITPSKYFRDLVSKWTSGRTPVEHIYNGIELPKDLPARAKARDNLKISQEKKIIVSAGRLVPWKGFFGLTNVVEKISKEYPSIHLYILGDGPDREKLQKKIEELEIERYVTLTGSQSRSDMFQYLVSADIFVLNTSFESFSFQVVEAMHAGVPVITTNIGSLPELVTHDKQGFLVVPDDSSRLESYIKKILDHQADVTSLGEEAKKKAQEFSIERTVNELVSKMSYENN